MCRRPSWAQARVAEDLTRGMPPNTIPLTEPTPETPAADDGDAVGAKGSTGAPPGRDPGDVSVGPTTPTPTQKRKADETHPDITLDNPNSTDP